VDNFKNCIFFILIEGIQLILLIIFFYSTSPIKMLMGPPVEILMASAATACMPGEAMAACNISSDSKGMENIR
jgi:hypothetical protein